MPPPKSTRVRTWIKVQLSSPNVTKQDVTKCHQMSTFSLKIHLLHEKPRLRGSVACPLPAHCESSMGQCDAVPGAGPSQCKNNAPGQKELFITLIQSIFLCPRCKPFPRKQAIATWGCRWQTFKKPDFLLGLPLPQLLNAMHPTLDGKNKYLQIKGFILLQTLLEIQCHFNHTLVLFLWAHCICMRSWAAGDEFPCASWGLFTMCSPAQPAWSSLNQKMCIVAN